jgi:hypothetical protein
MKSLVYCHSDYLGRKVKEVDHFNWENVSINEVIGRTKYPEHKK